MATAHELFACSICLDPMTQPMVVTPCTHRFCRACILDYRQQCQTNACPMCRREMTGGHEDRLLKEVMGVVSGLQLRATAAETRLAEMESSRSRVDSAGGLPQTREEEAAASDDEPWPEHMWTGDDFCRDDALPDPFPATRRRPLTDLLCWKKGTVLALDPRFKKHWSLVESQLVDSVCERCPVYPDCANEDECLYVHPTIPCRGGCGASADECLYLHRCKYSPRRCNIPGCYLRHVPYDREGFCIDDATCDRIGCAQRHRKKLMDRRVEACRGGRHCHGLRDSRPCGYYHPPGTTYARPPGPAHKPRARL